MINSNDRHQVTANGGQRLMESGSCLDIAATDVTTTAVEAATRAGLGSHAELQDVWLQDAPVTTHKALGVRGNEPYAMVTPKFHPLQHLDLAQALDDLGVKVQQVVSLRNGAAAWFGGCFETVDVDGDIIEGWVWASNAHGSGSAQLGFSEKRPICANQFGKLSRAAVLRVKHTAGIREFISQIPERIDLARRCLKDDVGQLQLMREMPLSRELRQEIIRRTYAPQLQQPIRDRSTGEMRERVIADLPQFGLLAEAYVSGRAIASGDHPDSAYRLLNAITEVETHRAPRAVGSDPVEAARKQFESLMTGQRSGNIERARAALTQLACA